MRYRTEAATRCPNLSSLEVSPGYQQVNFAQTRIIVMNIIDSVQLILPDHPGTGRQGRLKNTRELVIDGMPFIVVYREHASSNQKEILRVLHDANMKEEPAIRNDST